MEKTEATEDQKLLNNFIIGQRIDFINLFNKTFFTGIVKAIYDDFFAVQIDKNQPNYTEHSINSYIEFIGAIGSKAVRCRAQIVGIKNELSLDFVMLNIQTIISEVERRKYIRVPIIMEIQYCFLPDQNSITNLHNVDSIYSRKLKKSFTTNISQGGVNIITYEENCDNKFLLLSINIPEQINSICQVLRKEKDEDKDNYRTGLKFIRIDDRQSERLAKYIRNKIKSK